MNQQSKIAGGPRLLRPEQGLYRSEYEHDACGVGMVANLSGETSHAIVVNGMTILKRLMHRGATGNDPETGDGAGLLMKIPHSFFKKILAAKNAKIAKEEDDFGVAMIFGGEGEEEAIENAVRGEGCDVLAWRDVPTNPDAIGKDARAVMPRIRQLFIATKITKNTELKEKLCDLCDLCGKKDEVRYHPFDGIVLCDTFDLTEKRDTLPGIFPENSERARKQKKLDIRVIIGNPPYNVSKGTAYPHLEQRIAETYAKGSGAVNKNSLYDSYIKAFRWASDRIKDEGVIAFVTNGGWLDAQAMNGFRNSLVEEFDHIYVFNLRGNCRTQGELRRRECGNVFGLGSRTPVAITILVKGGKETCPYAAAKEAKLKRKFISAKAAFVLPPICFLLRPINFRRAKWRNENGLYDYRSDCCEMGYNAPSGTLVLRRQPYRRSDIGTWGMADTGRCHKAGTQAAPNIPHNHSWSIGCRAKLPHLRRTLSSTSN